MLIGAAAALYFAALWALGIRVKDFRQRRA
jgi:hypothetical protein